MIQQFLSIGLAGTKPLRDFNSDIRMVVDGYHVKTTNLQESEAIGYRAAYDIISQVKPFLDSLERHHLHSPTKIALYPRVNMSLGLEGKFNAGVFDLCSSTDLFNLAYSLQNAKDSEKRFKKLHARLGDIQVEARYVGRRAFTFGGDVCEAFKQALMIYDNANLILENAKRLKPSEVYRRQY